MIELSEDFQFVLEEFGRPIGGEQVPTEVLAAYADRVPQTMLDFWKECGTGLWLDGYFQLCRPDKYQELVSLILDGDPDFPPKESVLIGFSAFGKLLIWNNTNYFLSLSLYNKVAYTSHLNSNFPILQPNRELPAELSGIDDDTYDYTERTEKAAPLFRRALKKLGPLAYGECYGFVPARELGGLEILDEVHKRPALPYFRMVSQLAPIKLRYIDLENHKVRVLRDLGAQ
ncbi:MAG: GAD-like domain-containing protein [Acetobacter aceti]|uniref:GAD-related domain-containing protein n=1 Tax=Acetobacter aceti TaxID=435 RepID=A0A1U9KI90_ACEAC|nr:GAD-like domain-containing protein [Acetobacter aceti]AQS85524.1 hypothetical protein A0U92_12920 [Acetobacter aceti]